MPPKRKGTANKAANRNNGNDSDSDSKSAKRLKASNGLDDESPVISPVSSSAAHDVNAKPEADGDRRLKISSWNVNGIRAWLAKSGVKFIEQEQPDIVVLQEVKCGKVDLPKEAANIAGYISYWQATAAKEGYAGVGMYTKKKPLNVTFGMGIEQHDKEGRLITAEYEDFYLVSAYVPNSGRGLPRLSYRREWNSDFLKYITGLDAKKPVVYCGDLNVAHKEIDLANPKSNTKNAGFTKEEREDFTKLLDAGFVDSFRALYPNKVAAYTFWAYFGNARAKNVGWRLDYFVISERFMKHVKDNIIHDKVLGSDHCPISLLLDL